MKTGFLFPLNISIAIITVLLYYTPHIPPSEFWLAAFLPFLIPVFIILNLVFAIYWLFKNWRKALLSFMVIIAGHTFISRTIACNFESDKEVAVGLKIINYNVRVFNTYKHLQDKNMNSSKKMIQWLASSDAQVLCLEEFYNEKKSNIYNTITKLKKPYPYYHYVPFFTNPGSISSFGMSIFSKLPIINQGYLKLNSRSNNQILFADILFNKDTIRIYNMHLQSMSIKDNDLSISGSWREIFKKLKKGAIQRTSQINALISNIKNCPYPVIVCGDLNDTPYSYSYQTLRKYLNNSFEKAGNGMGFSYNGKLYLRIDQQFASSQFKIRKFTTHHEIKYSDHFPLEGLYSLDK